MNDTSHSLIVPQSPNDSFADVGTEIVGNQIEMVFDFAVGSGKVMETFAELGK